VDLGGPRQLRSGCRLWQRGSTSRVEEAVVEHSPEVGDVDTEAASLVGVGGQDALKGLLGLRRA
jgi:hypothetical protein